MSIEIPETDPIRLDDDHLRKDVAGGEFNLRSDAWLNIFDGMDLNFEKSAFYCNLSVVEKQDFKMFKDNFFQMMDKDTQTVPDDFTILRFLQADKYDQKLAMNRLISTLKWRKDKRLDQIATNPPKSLTEYRKIRVRSYMGFDKEGKPIFAERTGQFISAVSKKSLTQDELLDCYIYEMGSILQGFRETVKNGNPKSKHTTIIDFKGLKMVSAMKALGLFKAFAKQVEVYFPEQAGMVFIVNAPTFIAAVWKVVKQFLDPVLLEKIQLHHGIPKKTLLKYIDESVLFEEYGGTNKKPFPKAQI